MPQNGLFNAVGTAVVQQTHVAVDSGLQAQTPERWCSPFVAGRAADLTMIGQLVAEVVQQEVGIWLDGLVVEHCDR